MKWKRLHAEEISVLQVRKPPAFITCDVLEECIYLHLAHLFEFRLPITTSQDFREDKITIYTSGKINYNQV
jgi:hypothetical protein